MVHLIPHGAPHAGDPGALGVGAEHSRHLGNRLVQARTALPGRQVRGARRHAIDIGVGRVKSDGSSHEEPHGRWVRAGREVLGHGVEEAVGGRVEPGGDAGGDVRRVGEANLLPVQVGRGGKEVSAGEAEEAVVVEDGGAFVVRAQCLRVGEAGRDAVVASGGVLVAPALSDGVDHVRCRADRGGREASRGGRGVARQGRGGTAEVGPVSAVSSVVAGGVAA